MREVDFGKYIGQLAGKVDACWDLVEMVMADAGVPLPQQYGPAKLEWKHVSREEAAEQAASEVDWRQVARPYRPLDVLVFKLGPRLHTAVAMNTYQMIHAWDDIGVVVVRWNENWRRNLIGAYRYDPIQ